MMQLLLLCSDAVINFMHYEAEHETVQGKKYW